jgi:hypothetical protein
MFEFAQADRLWLLALLAVFLLAWVLARRYRRHRVTYGMVWRRVAERVTPPGWRRILKTLLTLAIALAALAGVAMFAAGLQRPADEAPAPIICVLVLDNSVAMRAGSPSRAELAHQRATEVLRSLHEDDRAVVAWFRHGQPVLSQWLRAADALPPVPPTDFAEADLGALHEHVAALGTPPGTREDAVPVILWLGNTKHDLPTAQAPARLAGLGRALRLDDVPLFVDGVPGELENNFLTRAEYTPPSGSDPHSGVLEVECHAGTPVVRVLEGSRVILETTANRVDLPLSSRELTVRMAVPEPGALPDDDWLEFRVPGLSVSDVVLVYPDADGEPNPWVLETLKSFLPGRDIRALPGSTATVRADLLVADRVLPDDYSARALLCFGVIPPERGSVGAPVRADPNLRAPVPPYTGDLDVPDLTMLSAGEAVPLFDHAGLQPLTRHLEGGTLVAAGPGLLYSGFIPHESTLLQDGSGLLLLLRWIEALQRVESPVAPLLARAGSALELELGQVARLELVPMRWDGAYRPPGFELVPGPDGRVTFALPDTPARWRVVTGGEPLAEIEALWTRPDLQVPATVPDRLNLSAMRHPEQTPDWRDLLPGLLLWLALGLIVIEWLFWLTGITD